MNSEQVQAFAQELGFDLAGVASAEATPESEFFEKWLNHGYAGQMQYLERQKKQRLDPSLLLPGVRSVIVCAMNYNTAFPYTQRSPDRAWISRYAWGGDYHEVLRKKLAELASWLELQTGARTRIFVDGGPVLERAFARQIGRAHV